MERKQVDHLNDVQILEDLGFVKLLLSGNAWIVYYMKREHHKRARETP